MLWTLKCLPSQTLLTKGENAIILGVLTFAAEKLLSYKLAGITQFEAILSMYSYSHFLHM